MNAKLSQQRFRGLLVVAFAFFSLVVGVLGYLLYTKQEEDIRTDDARELSAIADLKLGELINWRRERGSDALVIFRNRATARQFKEFLDNPSARSLRRELVGWIGTWRINYNYGSILFLDQKGVVRLSAARQATDISSDTRNLAIEAALARKVIFSDLHKDEITHETCLDLLVPLLVPQARDTICAGIILLRVDPSKFLYPFIQSWPTPSRTGETLLLRREGNDVVFLNELRHRKDTALSFRLPLTDESLPAVMAVRGREGIVEGIDYRGVPVVAAIRRIPDTQWFLVAKVDQEELYALIWTRLGLIGGIIALIILAGGIGTAFVWRTRSAHLYQKLYESETQRHIVAEQYSHLTKYANDIILLMAADGRLMEANDRALAAYGYARDELLQLNNRDLRAPETVAVLERDLKKVQERNGNVFETLHRRKEGSIFPVEVSSRVITIGESRIYQHIIRDITERKRAEEHISRLNRLYAVLGQINQTIIRSRDRNRLFEEICRVAVETGKFRMAWIGFVEADGKTVRPVASRGVVDGYLTDIRIVVGDEREGREPTGTAIPERKIIICNDVASDARVKPWRERMLQRGYRSSAAVPILLEGRAVGSFNVYADEVDFFDKGEIHLLEEIAGDIAYALGAIQQEEKRRRAEEELQSLTSRYQAILTAVPDIIAEVDNARVYTWANKAGYEFFGEDIIGKEAASYFLGEQKTYDMVQPLFTGKEDVIYVESWQRRKDGESRLLAWWCRVLKDPRGNVRGALSTGRDITELRRAEESLHLQAAALESSANSMVITDSEGTIRWVNPAFTKMTGYPLNEVLGQNPRILKSGVQDKRFYEQLWKTILSGNVWQGQVTNRRKNGEHYVEEMTITPVHDSAGKITNFIAIKQDITERKRAEEALRESERRYHTLTEISPVGIFRTDSEGRTTYVNQRWCEITGSAPSEALGYGWLSAVHPQDRQSIESQWEEATEAHGGSKTEYRFKRPDGTVTWVIGQAIPEKNEKGEVVAYIGTLTDITERKRDEEERIRSEKEHRESRDRLELALEGADLGMWDWSIPTNQNIYNARWAEMLGYSLDELDPSYFTWVELIHPEDRARVVGALKAHVEGKTPTYETEHRLRTKSGEWKWILDRGKVLEWDDQGKPVRAAGTHMDITERKQAENQISLLAHTVRSISECVSITDLNDIILFVNNAFLTTYGYDEHEVLGRNIDIVGSPNNPPELLSEMRKAARETGWQGELLNRAKDGREFPISLSTSVVRDDNGRAVALVGVAADITDRKRMDDQLRKSEERFRKIFDESQIGIIASAPDYRFEKVNPAFCRMIGYTPNELASMTFADITHPDDVGKDMENIKKLGLGAIPFYKAEKRYVRKSGETIWGNIVLSSVRNNDGSLQYYLGMIEDITERKRAEEALNKERSLLRALMDNVPDHIYFKDTNSRFVTVSKAQADRFGLNDPSQASGKTDFDFFTEEHARPAFEDEQKIIQSGQPIVGVEEKETWPDGQVTWVSSTKMPLRDMEGNIVGTFGISRDITERKRAEEELIRSEGKFRTIFDNASDGMFLVDLKTRKFFMCNATCARMLGYVEEEFPNLHVADIHPEEDLGFINEQIGKYSKGEEGIRRDIRFKRKDGSIFEADLSPALLTIAEKKYLLIIFKDITERKRMEKMLRENEQRLKVALTCADTMVFNQDKDLRYTWVFNPQLGLLPEAAVGKTDADLFPRADVSKLIEVKRKVLKSGVGAREEVQIVLDHQEIVVLFSVEPLRDSLGAIVGLTGAMIDITERKLAELEIRRNREWLQAILDASRDGILAEKGETIAYVNASFARMYGYDDPAELIGKHATAVLAPEESRRLMDLRRRRLLGESMPNMYEFTGVRKGGKTVQLEASVSTALVAGEGYIISTVRDISERKSLQKQLIEAQKMESIGTLAGGIAHDFNNILGIIMGHSSLLERRRDDPEKYSQSADAINQATFRGAGLVRQLLTFARKMDVAMQSVLINDTLKELAKLLEEILPKTIIMELNLKEKLPSIHADPTQVHQVFLNLCVNARDAMTPKGGRLTLTSRLVSGEAVSAKFHRADATEYIIVDVADTGTGMDEATRSRIFEPFFTTKEKGKGTGLGLATAYGIVESHRGFIDVESTVGMGSTFHVYLPVEPRHMKPQELEKAAEKDVPGGTETILVVEDEETLRDLICLVLEGRGYTVVQASDGEEGLQQFAKHQNEIGLVLTDLGLPKMSGEDLLNGIRDLKPEAKIILASGYVEPGMRSALLKGGAKEIIQKPYVPVEVLRKIREVLDSPDNVLL